MRKDTPRMNAAWKRSGSASLYDEGCRLEIENSELSVALHGMCNAYEPTEYAKLVLERIDKNARKKAIYGETQ